MVRTHPSTPDERAQWTAYMLAHRGDYGVVTRLSRETGVSRPTLYAWRAQAARAVPGLHAARTDRVDHADLGTTGIDPLDCTLQRS